MNINNPIKLLLLIVMMLAFRTGNAFDEAQKNELSNDSQLKIINRSGQETADLMNSNYEKVVDNCGSPSRPAFLCSGILFRGTDPDTSYNSWDPSPASVKSGGVSFSYLRKDAKYSKLAYSYLNGFVFYPYSYAPNGKNTNLDVMCMFPIDAATNETLTTWLWGISWF